MIARVVVQINPLVDGFPVETDDLLPETLEWDFLPYFPQMSAPIAPISHHD